MLVWPSWCLTCSSTLYLAFRGLPPPTLALTGSSGLCRSSVRADGCRCQQLLRRRFLPPRSSLVRRCVVIRRWGNILAGLLRWIGSVLLIACELRMHVAWWNNVFHLVLLPFVLAASCARWYVLLVGWRYWKGLSGLIVNPTSASVVSTHGKWRMVALLIRWHCYVRICLRRGLWCSNLRVLGSAYLPSSLTRSRAYLRCIWRWSSRWVTSTLRIGQPTVDRRMKQNSRALRSSWMS